MSSHLALYDYRTQVIALYRERNRALLAGENPADVLERFRAGRNTLFATHAQSALDEEQQRVFEGLHYFPYNAAMCIEAELDTQVEPKRQQVAMNAEEAMLMTTVGLLHFVVESQAVTLSLYWLDIYGGGLFLPFRDTTCPQWSYGAGRYLFDTIKGSDFLWVAGATGKRMVLDFNYAYNPSCAYNDRWFCPLAPAENRLQVPIRAGEIKYKE